MGGKGSGGARLGSGPSRKVGSVRWQREQRRLRHSPRAESVRKASPIASVPKPKDLPAGQSAVWDMLAPHALAQRTLTPATAFAFRELCEAVVLKRDVLAVVEQDGLMQNRLSTKMDQDGGGEQVFESKAHPLIAKWTALLVRVEAGLTRFRLAPMGKEMPAVEEPKDEWSEFDAPLSVIQGGKKA